MATRIAHISDLHFPAKSADQVKDLRRSILDRDPNMVIVTGDLTRSGKKTEFAEAKAFMASLHLPAMVLPGNHDIPIPGIFDRMSNPFRRFALYFSSPTSLETPDVIIVGLNTAVGWQPRLDWSLGYIKSDRVGAAVSLLKAQGRDRLRIVACHHPLHSHPLDPIRSRTCGGEKAFDQLRTAGMDLLLHGHLHRTDCRCHSTTPVVTCEVCANTALANRQRGGPAGYNIIDVEEGRWKLTVIEWQNGGYQASTSLVGCNIKPNASQRSR
jgi:3',5'-cyclic AMP phosphodiesterase CpdA